MKKWMIRVKDVLAQMNLAQKVQENKMTSADWAALEHEYQKLHGSSLKSDKEADEDVETSLSADLQNEIISFVGVATGEAAEAPKTAGEGVQMAINAGQQIQAKVVEQAQTIQKLSAQPESAEGQSVGVGSQAVSMATRVLGFAGHTNDYLFGIETPAFKRGNFWTEMTVTRKPVNIDEVSPSDKKAFMAAFNDYRTSFMDRFKTVHENGLLGALDFNKMMAGQSVIDYSGLDAAGEYITRRSDLIIAHLRTLPSVAGLFPTISNVQNKEVAPSVSFGELSQGYRKGAIFKGNVDFAAEIYGVNDVMFKYEFDDLIKLEKAYIGYLNQNDGSNVIKWAFIEYIMVHFATQLQNERNRRAIVGVSVPAQSVAANPAVFGADGILRAIQKKEDEFKVLPFDTGVYTEATIIDTVESFWDQVEETLLSMDGYKLYMNAKHRRMYTRAFREKYGKDNDFTGVNGGLQDVNPDSIVWVPNMASTCYKMWITLPGNICLLENKPGEMTGFYFERDFETVTVQSRWKEGAHVKVAGIKYESRAKLEAAGRADQYLFTNFPATELEAGAVKVPGKDNDLFVTSANTGATAITSIDNASPERVYRIVCGNMTNATTIAKAGNFASITAAWTPKAVGDWIELYAELEDYTVTVDGQSIKRTRATGKFLELGRSVTA
ncbi:MAG: hypothetical protein RR346_04900 [Bacteroidales bacterium]